MNFASSSLLLALAAFANAQTESLGLQSRPRHRRAVTSSPIEPPEEDDFTFVVNEDVGLDTDRMGKDDPTLQFTVKINRVFGDIAAQQAAGILSDTAAVFLPAYDVDFADGEWDQIILNGNRLTPYLTGDDGIWKLNTYYVPLDFLNFPADPGEGGTVQPADNVFTVDIDLKGEGWIVSFDWAAIQFQKAPRPVVLFHGLLSDSTVWASQWVTKLDSLGILNDATGELGNYDSIQSNADLIAAKVSAARARWGVREVDIVAHSKGALDARHYAETATDVANVIQVAGPNGGTPLADFGQLASIAALSVSNTVIINYFASEAAVQLTTDYMTIYNTVHGLNGDVLYTSLAGDYDPDCAAATPSCRLLDRLFLSISGAPGDIVVPQWSAHHLNGTSKLIHASIWSDESAKHYPLIQSEDVFNQLQDIVPTSLDTALVAPTPDYQVTLSLAGTVAQGGTFEASLDLDGTTEAYVVLLFPSDTLGLTLTAPDATTVDTTYAANNPGIVGYEDSDFFQGKVATYNLVSPQVGRWSVQVTGDVVSASEIPFVINAYLYQPDITLEASLATTSVLTGTPLVYFAEVTDSGSPVLGATAKATVALPNNSLATVTLLDDGLGPDAAADDGVYTGSLADTSQPGNYRAAVSVEKTGSPSFTREAFVLGAASDSTVTCTNFGETPRDNTDTDTLYNFLDITFDVSTTIPNDYIILATLTDSAGNEQNVRQKVTVEGSASVTLTFDGETIFDNGVNGPYTLSSLRIAAESEFATAIVADLQDLYTTTSYSYTEFQRDPLRLVGGTTQGVDTNSNKLFDRLDIEMFVESTIAGSYKWSATLRDSEDTEIGFDFGTITIASGSNTINLSFDGVTIGDNWVDGPYFVSDFILFGAVGAESLVVNSKAYTTDALRWREFEHTIEPPTVSPYPSLTPTEYPTTSPTISPTSSPTTSPTTSPTQSPTTSPTASPTTSPTESPTTSPTESPTSNPSESPTASPTVSPTESPTGSPIIVDTDGDGLSDNYELDPNPYVTNPKVPDTDGDGLTDAEEDAIGTDPNNKDTDGDGLEDGYEVNISKTDPLERQPTPAPTKSPTRSPTSSPSFNPSGFPSSSPSLLPSSQPSIVTQIVRTPGTISTNKEFCSFSDAERSAFTDAAERTLVEFACPGSETCTAGITSSCGQSQGARRDLSSLSRQLQASSNWQVEYVVVEEFTCERATCTSPSDITRVNAIAETIASNMNGAMSSGQYKESFAVKIIQSAALDNGLVECLLVWGTVGSPETEVGSGGTGIFYPDWTNYSGTCLQDGNQPTYMELSPIWLSDSLEECCSRFYPGWNFNKCLNPNGSGLWYVDHENGKCVTDCDESSGGTCGGFANLVSNDFYISPRSCCESELFYRYIEFCEADSLLSECYEGTGLFYRGDNGGKEVCARDCDPASGDTTCGGIVEDAYIKLYETAEACCTAEYNWIDVELCAARTTQTSLGKYWPDKDNSKCVKDLEMPSSELDVQIFGSLEECCASGISWLSKGACFAASGIAVAEIETNKFYIDWINQYCVQDCEGSAPCGGLAQAWDTVYDSASACCAQLPGRTADDCVYS